jgi:hypothetical protein
MLDFNNQKQQAYFVAVVVPLLVNGASEAWFGYRDQRATLSSRLHAERSDLHRGRRLSVPRLCDRDLGRQRQRRQLQGTTGTAYSCSSSRTIGHAPCSWTAWITCSAAI